MSIRRTLVIARKEFRHITRDIRTLFLVTVSPAFLLLLLAYIFSFEATHLILAVLDEDRSALSRRYVAALTADGDFEVRYFLNGHEEIDPLLLRGEVDAALVIPPGFAAHLQGGRSIQVLVVVDGTDPIAAGQLIGYLDARTTAFAGGIQVTPRTLRASALEVRTQARYNPGVKSMHSMVPGLLAIVLTLPAMAMALALAREKETSTLEGLMATPVRGSEYLLGKLLAYVVSGLLSALLALLVAVLWFRVPFRGRLLVFLALTADFLLASMGISLLVGNFVSSQQTAMFIVLLIFIVPSFFMAGLILPVSGASVYARIPSYSLPTTHFVTICRAVFLKGSDLPALARPALVLAGMGGGTLLIGVSLFRKKI